MKDDIPPPDDRLTGKIKIAQVASPTHRNALAGNWREQIITAKALRTEKFAQVNFFVLGLMPEGVTLLVSKPKLGKSWLILDLCSAATTGRYTLGSIKPAQGDVLYVALEDSTRRLQRRLSKLLPSFNGEWPEGLRLATKWNRLHEGGAHALREWCLSVERPTLMAIDTLALIRPPAKPSQQAYQSDYEAMTFLHDLTQEFPGLAIIVVHHDRKMEAEDVFDTVSGTQGLIGAADTIWVIKRRASGTTLHVRGRDVEESEKAMEFNKTTCRWTILGPAAEIQRSNERARALAALHEAGEPLSVNEIKEAAQLRNRNAADLLLGKMARDGEIKRVDRGRYAIPPTTGQIGQTERLNGQAIDVPNGSGDLSNLSALSVSGDRTETGRGNGAYTSVCPPDSDEMVGGLLKVSKVDERTHDQDLSTFEKSEHLRTKPNGKPTSTYDDMPDLPPFLDRRRRADFDGPK
jgi:hypothetical protein